MKFRTELDWTMRDISIDHESKLIFLGSCFAENFGRKFVLLKFNTSVNPNGIVFHPLPIFEILTRAIKNETYNSNDLVKRDAFNFSWFHHSQYYNANDLELLEHLNAEQHRLNQKLKSADFLFVTFGTAWGYELNSSEKIVANCHKTPSSNFNKKLSLCSEIARHGIELIKLLHEQNPNLKILFSVSPVRHIKDGITENSRSKAELISATHQIIEATKNTTYIPAYEWLIDDLRDYRFYANDKVHPSTEAIEYIWKKISQTLFEKNTLKNIQKIEEILAAANHKPFHMESKQHQKFLNKTISKIDLLEGSIKNSLRKELEKLKAQLI